MRTASVSALVTAPMRRARQRARVRAAEAGCSARVGGRSARIRGTRGRVHPRRIRMVLPRAEGEGGAGTPGAGDAVEDAETEKPKEYVKPQMSEAQREKLRQEYLGLGGAANSKMGSNWFLNISLFIAFLAVFVKLTGTIDL